MWVSFYEKLRNNSKVGWTERKQEGKLCKCFVVLVKGTMSACAEYPEEQDSIEQYISLSEVYFTSVLKREQLGLILTCCLLGTCPQTEKGIQ